MSEFLAENLHSKYKLKIFTGRTVSLCLFYMRKLEAKQGTCTHRKTAEFVKQYIMPSIKDKRNTPLFCNLSHRGNVTADRVIDRMNVFHMISQRTRKTGLAKESVGVLAENLHYK